MSVRSARESFSELCARERARVVLDPGTFRELLDPFARVRSPYLAEQGVVAQSDDGVVIARGTIDGASAVAIATDGRYLGGSIGEIGSAKIAAALECALAGPTRAVIAFDSGGIRLQEANLGILGLAEIYDAIVALRARVPVIGVIAGRVGVYGGMGIAASLCSAVVMTEGARWGLNGPDVIETEAGIAELDARDRPLIWRTTGGKRRYAQGHADALVPDDAAALRDRVRELLRTPPPRRALAPAVDADPALTGEAFAAAYAERYA